MLGNSLRSGIGTIFEKTPDDQAAHFLLGAIATGIIKHVAMSPMSLPTTAFSSFCKNARSRLAFEPLP